MLSRRRIIAIMVVLAMLICMASTAYGALPDKDFYDYTYQDYDALTKSEQDELREAFLSSYNARTYMAWLQALDDARKAAEEHEYIEDITFEEEEAINLDTNVKGELTSLLSSVSAGQTIQLIENLTEKYSNESIIALKNCKLDLNGYKLCVMDIDFTSGTIIDSSQGDGYLDVKRYIFLENNGESNKGYFPIKDKDGVYRFFELKIINGYNYLYYPQLVLYLSKFSGNGLQKAFDVINSASDDSFVCQMNLVLKTNGNKPVTLKVKTTGSSDTKTKKPGDLLEFLLTSYIKSSYDINDDNSALYVYLKNVEKIKGYSVDYTTIWKSETGFTLSKSSSKNIEEEVN